MILKLELGKRYKLPHGFGTLKGHETNDPLRSGFTLFSPKLPKHDSPHLRYIFEIEPCSWLTEMTSAGYGPDYAAWGTQIQEVGEFE